MESYKQLSSAFKEAEDSYTKLLTYTLKKKEEAKKSSQDPPPKASIQLPQPSTLELAVGIGLIGLASLWFLFRIYAGLIFLCIAVAYWCLCLRPTLPHKNALSLEEEALLSQNQQSRAKLLEHIASWVQQESHWMRLFRRQVAILQNEAHQDLEEDEIENPPWLKISFNDFEMKTLELPALFEDLCSFFYAWEELIHYDNELASSPEGQQLREAQAFLLGTIGQWWAETSKLSEQHMQGKKGGWKSDLETLELTLFFAQVFLFLHGDAPPPKELSERKNVLDKAQGAHGETQDPHDEILIKLRGMMQLLLKKPRVFLQQMDEEMSEILAFQEGRLNREGLQPQE